MTIRRAALAVLFAAMLLLPACTDAGMGSVTGLSRKPGDSDDVDSGSLGDLLTDEKFKNGEISVDMGTLPEIRINLCALGDIMAHDGTYMAAQVGETYQFDYMFRDIAPYTDRADYIVGNLETVFAGKDRTYSSYPAFNTPEQMGESLARVLGIDLLSTANNHSMDRGLAGIASTLDFLDEYGIAHTGTYRDRDESGEIFTDEINGAEIAFLAYTYGLNGAAPNNYSVNIISKDALLRDAQLARENGADYIVALLHWGEEYQNKPSKKQRELAEWLFINTEIDLIIGNHPHVTQTVEKFEVERDGFLKTGYVLYALGNFTSEQLFEYSNTGILANIHIIIDRDDYRNNRVEEITYTPVFVDPNPKATGRRYRVVAISDAIASYERGTDTLISQKEYTGLVKYMDYYKELLETIDIVSEYRLS